MLKKKQSKNEWIGDIPIKWNEKPIRYVFNEIKEKNKLGLVTKALKFTYGTIISKTDFDADEDNYVANTILTYNIVSPGTIMINCLNLNYDFVSQRIGLVKDNGVITSAYLPIKPINDNVIDSEYANYQLKAWDNVKAFHNMGSGVRKTLDFNELGKKYILLPPIEMQKRIVSYLNLKCAEIDALHTDIEKQIETLEEYKKSIITEAVTKGLDPDVEMKDSGIEWIGKIPKDWEIRKGKYTLRYLQKEVKEDDGVITCFRDGEVTLRSNRREDGFTMSDKEIGYQGIDIGDLVVHGMDGFAGAIGISDSRGKASPVLNVLDTDENKKYYMYYLRSMAYSNVFLATATGIRVRSCDLRWVKIAELPFPMPSRKEQDEIVSYIDRICNGANEIIADKKKQLETLEQYKKSLIYEYVTGKKEVSNE